MDPVEIEFEKIVYVYRDGSWFDKKSFQAPPYVTIKKLEVLLNDSMDDDISSSTDISQLSVRQHDAKQADNTKLAIRIAERILEIQPGRLRTIASLSSLYRKELNSEKALEITEPYKDSENAPIQCSRAAALCDRQKWEEAKMHLDRSFKLQYHNPEGWSVRRRIEKECPGLY